MIVLLPLMLHDCVKCTLLCLFMYVEVLLNLSLSLAR